MRNETGRLEELFLGLVESNFKSKNCMTPIEQYRALLTILYKEIHRFMRIWTQTLIPPAIMIMLYFVIFGTLIGKRIGQMGGFDYMQFMIPGSDHDVCY
jgi:hypothetical protein